MLTSGVASKSADKSPLAPKLPSQSHGSRGKLQTRTGNNPLVGSFTAQAMMTQQSVKPLNLALMGRRTGVAQSDSPYKQQLVVNNGSGEGNVRATASPL